MEARAGYIDPNWPNPNGSGDASIIIYGYTPSLAVGILGVVLFFVALITHLYLLSRYRTWYFSTVSIGTMMEVVGYTFRILSSRQDPYRVAWFVIQYFFIVVAPVFFSAAIYSIASILAIVYGKQYSPLPPKFILWIFIVCDIVATITQVAGAALVGVAYSNQRDPKTYNHILLAGLAFQVFSFAVFLCVLFTTLQKSKQSRETINRGFLVALVVATVMVYLRTCFRLAETAEGLMAYLSTHEVFFGCLEFLPIVVAVYLLTYWHPGRWLDKTPTGKDRRRIAIEGAERQ